MRRRGPMSATLSPQEGITSSLNARHVACGAGVMSINSVVKVDFKP
jgi:hypothetical protein